MNRMLPYRALTLRFTKFSLIGMGNGAIDLLALNVLLGLFPTRSDVGLILINTSAYILAVLNSYYWNARITFKKEATFSAREKVGFAIQAAASLAISNLVFVLCADWLAGSAVPLWIGQNLSKGLSMLLSSLCSYFFMRQLVFRRWYNGKASS